MPEDKQGNDSADMTMRNFPRRRVLGMISLLQRLIRNERNLEYGEPNPNFFSFLVVYQNMANGFYAMTTLALRYQCYAPIHERCIRRQPTSQGFPEEYRDGGWDPWVLQKLRVRNQHVLISEKVPSTGGGEHNIGR